MTAFAASDAAASGMSERVPIALVEDNERLRTELVFHLTHAGYAVAGLPDGAALDAHLAGRPCRVLVLDLGLPDEDGLSICERLRRTRPDLGIIMLTARGMAHHRLAGLRGGADAYLVKPARTEELLLVIANLLRRLGPVAPEHPLPPLAGRAPRCAPPHGHHAGWQRAFANARGKPAVAGLATQCTRSGRPPATGGGAGWQLP
ncbi:two component transcriptional regulator [Cupriavidus basilensis OR16]|uniref:Two component transcriptional regulator n=1 Tax=Cupriavidus basilensis OR16 TaxID=1127483 RepID=H1S9J4_9BURK|nr:response regulator transcription factor [Cupriavidus basilensis]EHP40770.1 two component transcriptional regulator [Cupriavidus basilensis OR16]